MKKIFLTIAALAGFLHLTFAQTLLSSEFLGHRTEQQLNTQFIGQTFLNGTNMYRVTYETKNLDGSTTVASGLICIPDDLTKRYPLLCYAHGTAGYDDDVPSNLGFDADFAIAFSGKGYVSFAPDYLGLGVHEGVHPYVHAASEAWVSLDLLKATHEFADQQGVAINEQLFITGYSQGGHAAMAFHRLLEQTGEFEVTAAAPMSGPYSIGEVMRDLILSGEPYTKPGYLINTIVSYQAVYGDVYTSIQDAFKTPYQNLVQQYTNDQIPLADMDAQLVTLLNANVGAVIPIEMLKDDYVAEITNNPDHPANLHLKDNNTYDNWAAQAPTRLFYCKADEQVPYENSILAATAMQAAGAVDVQAVDVFSNFNHFICALFAPNEVITFFENYQLIEDLSTALPDAGQAPFEIFPNPASDFLVVKNLPANSQLHITTLSGTNMIAKSRQQGNIRLDMSGWESGMYLLQVIADGQTWLEKVLVN